MDAGFAELVVVLMRGGESAVATSGPVEDDPTSRMKIASDGVQRDHSVALCNRRPLQAAYAAKLFVIATRSFATRRRVGG